MTDYCQLWLTCEDKAEANKIARSLLEKHLIACARQVPVTSDYLWEGKIDHSEEIMIMMESRLSLFDKVEREVSKLHSYDSFVLEAAPVSRISRKAASWLGLETQDA